MFGFETDRDKQVLEIIPGKISFSVCGISSKLCNGNKVKLTNKLAIIPERGLVTIFILRCLFSKNTKQKTRQKINAQVHPFCLLNILPLFNCSTIEKSYTFSDYNETCALLLMLLIRSL